ncbi:hypothetical protein DFH27DRAFT_578708 [Peziza echinospora]|nr:hypothetical protein DFH27DRAFT_578708 [Peziza echinospora]
MSFIRESSNQPRGLTVPEAQSIQRTSASPPPAYQTGYSTWKPNRSTLTAPTPPHGNVAGEQGGRAVNMSGLLEALGGALGGAVGTSTPAPKLGRFSQASSGKCYNVNKPLPPIPHPNNDPNSGSKPPVRAPSNQQSLARDFQNDCLGNRWDNPIVIDPEVEPEYVTDLDTEQDWDVEIEGSPFNVASSRSENVHTNKNSNNNNFNTPTPRSRWPSEPEQLYDIFRPFDEIDVGNMSDILELPPTQVLPSEASASPDAPKMIWRPRPPSKHTRGASISKSGRDATGTSSHGSRSSSDKSKKSSRRSSIRR